MSDINTPFIIVMKHYDEKVAIKRDRSDLTYSEVFDMFIRASKSLGFHEDTINDTILQKSFEIERYDTDATTI